MSCKVFENANPELDSALDDMGEEGKQADSSKPQYACRGYGFVCFTRCEDARKALEHFHDKGDESSVSIDVQSSSKGGDDSNIAGVSMANLPKLYVVPALKKELREAYVRMRTLKFKKQMAR